MIDSRLLSTCTPSVTGTLVDTVNSDDDDDGSLAARPRPRRPRRCLCAFSRCVRHHHCAVPSGLPHVIHGAVVCAPARPRRLVVAARCALQPLALPRGRLGHRCLFTSALLPSSLALTVVNVTPTPRCPHPLHPRQRGLFPPGPLHRLLCRPTILHRPTRSRPGLLLSWHQASRRLRRCASLLLLLPPPDPPTLP